MILEKTASHYTPINGLQITIEMCAQFLDELGITIRNDLLSKETKVTGRLGGYSEDNAANTLPVILADLLRLNGGKGVTTTKVTEFLSCIADANRFNPIEEYLTPLIWDGTDRLPGLYAAMRVEEEKYQTYIRKWLIQCVALGLNNEKRPIGAEGVLVLLGGQGIGKTSIFRILCPVPSWFAEGVSLDMTNKDSLIRAVGSWICELGELDATTKREQPALKAFITSPEDKIRYPYDRAAIRAARRTSFCGTVNDEAFLRDTTGSRRYWTVPVHNMRKDMIFSLTRKSIDQLWAQVYHMYLENKRGFRLTDAEMQQLQKDNRSFEALLPYETEIYELLNPMLPQEQWEWWSVSRLQQYNLLQVGRGWVRH